MPAALALQMRALLEDAQGALPLPDLLVLVDEFVLQCSSSPEPEVLLSAFEQELETINREVIDHSSVYQTEVFLAVLYHLRPVLPSISIISSWFDLVLRPALREPRLPTAAVNHAKECIISALQKNNDVYAEKVNEFRRRLLDLYLLDAYNEGSGDDVLEWAELDQDQRDKRTLWKHNLEDILLTYGKERPEDLMTEIYLHFQTPSSRLQLLILLNLYTSCPSFQASSPVLATHDLMSSLLTSLLLDSSSTVCTIGLTLMIKLLPIFAVHACNELRHMLPTLLAILARVMCWKERPSSIPPDSLDEVSDAVIEEELETESRRILQVRSNLDWQPLEVTFTATASSAPSPRQYFSVLYYLFPCNVLRFLRNPVKHLQNHGLETPYTVDWAEALDEDQIRSTSGALLRGHMCHPLIVWRDSTAELEQVDLWAHYDVAQIASESALLDGRNVALALAERHKLPETKPKPPPSSDASSTVDDGGATPSSRSHPIDLSSGRAQVSLQDMIATSVALKSNLNLEVVNPTASWPPALFRTISTSPYKGDIQLPNEDDSASMRSHNEMPSHIAQAISGLQREALLLRNELNFELWLSRENVKHVGRLYQDRILSKNAEAERQGLYNKLRKYRAQVIGLENELREHKARASSAKDKYSDWNTELQKKLREFREEKKSWISEAATLRTAEKEARALSAAQGRLLADAAMEVFRLQTQKKETQPKIDRLRDYEKQIEQHLKMQRVWDEDFRKFNERADEMELMRSEYRKMEMRLESYEKTQVELEDDARGYRRQIQALEARLAAANRKATTTPNPGAEIAAFAAEKATLNKANAKLREDNADLRDEIEEMTAMVEVLKGQITGRKGLVSARASPILYV